MAQSHSRLRRLLTDELGECQDEDCERRLEELETLKESIDVERTDEDVDALSALSNETRYLITRLLSAADDELCVCELTPLLDVSESAISHALSTLVDAGMVKRRKDGRWRYYRTTQRANALLAVLDGTREHK